MNCEKTTIDYRSLLKRYIEHVGAYEGVSFLGPAHRNPETTSYLRFTDDEWAELLKLDAETGRS